MPQIQPTPYDPNFEIHGEIPPDISRQQTIEIAEVRALSDKHFTENQRVPAGYTYLAQLMVHDITHLRTTVGKTWGEGVRPPYLYNDNDGALNLSTIFGDGPRDDGRVFANQGRRFAWEQDLVGAPPPWRPYVQPGVRPAVQNGKFLLADSRNGDNTVLLQLRNLFCLFYEQVRDRMIDQEKDPQPNNIAARQVVEEVYRTIIKHDLAPRLLTKKFARDINEDDDALTRHAMKVLTDENGVYREFVFAAGRIGHSMVRNRYPISDALRAPENRPDPSLTNMVGAGKPVGFNATWLANWRYLFDIDYDDKPLLARRISPVIDDHFLSVNKARHNTAGDPLKGAANDPETGNAWVNLSETDVLRSTDGLATGQEYARRIGESWVGPPLEGTDLALELDGVLDDPDYTKQKDKFAAFNTFTKETPHWRTRTPLLIYLLIEAHNRRNGLRLGRLGSFIFGAAIQRALGGLPADSPIRSMSDLFKAFYPQPDLIADAIRHSHPAANTA